MHVFKSEKMMPEAAREMQLTQSCFVINDYCTQWPLFKKGSFTSIIEHFPEDNILIEEGINKSATVGITVDDYIDRIKKCTLVSPDYSLQEGRYYTHAELAELNIPFESVMLHPGDFLYFPMHWWHQAKTIECSVTFIHSTVNSFNLTAFLNDSIALMPAYIQRIQSAAKKRSYFGNKINWLCNGFRALG